MTRAMVLVAALASSSVLAGSPGLSGTVTSAQLTIVSKPSS